MKTNKQIQFILILIAIGLIVLLSISIFNDISQEKPLTPYHPPIVNAITEEATIEETTIEETTIEEAIIEEALPSVSGTIREVTAYNAGDPNQCWGDPCESANGENICLALAKGYKRCATNFVPFGTILHIEHWGECMVTDRMNSRYTNRVDVAMRLDEKQRALNFGLQRLHVTIVKLGDNARFHKK